MVRLALGVAALGGVSALQMAWTGSSALRLAHRAAPGPRLTAPLPRRNLLTPMHMAKSDEALLMGAAEGGRGGAYTSSNPEDRRIKPKDVAGRAKFKVVYVVLESQYQASMSKAAQKINDQQKNVCVEVVGYLLEELRDEGNYAKFQEDVADANVFIGSLIFVQELAEKVEAAVAPLRDQLDAVIVFPSMPEVMRLNKVGSFTMANLGQSKSIVADFMKSKKKQDGSSFEEGMLKLLRTLPKVLKYLPGDKAADAKSFMMSFQYWLAAARKTSKLSCSCSPTSTCRPSRAKTRFRKPTSSSPCCSRTRAFGTPSRPGSLKTSPSTRRGTTPSTRRRPASTPPRRPRWASSCKSRTSTPRTSATIFP